MANVTVSREQFRYADLPRICAKTGRPADRVVVTRFEYLPGWTYLLLFAGIFPFLIAAFFARKQVEGSLPISDAALDRYHAHRPYRYVGLALTAAGFALTIAMQQPWLLVVAGAGVLLLVGTELSRTWHWVSAVGVSGTPDVELRRVHPAFAAAVERSQRARLAAG